MDNNLKKDITAILEDGPVAISDLRKQLIGINCTKIENIWQRIPAGYNFEIFLETNGFELETINIKGSQCRAKTLVKLPEDEDDGETIMDGLGCGYEDCDDPMGRWHGRNK
jgi:hypothetical protein